MSANSTDILDIALREMQDISDEHFQARPLSRGPRSDRHTPSMTPHYYNEFFTVTNPSMANGKHSNTSRGLLNMVSLVERLKEANQACDIKELLKSLTPEMSDYLRQFVNDLQSNGLFASSPSLSPSTSSFGYGSHKTSPAQYNNNNNHTDPTIYDDKRLANSCNGLDLMLEISKKNDIIHTYELEKEQMRQEIGQLKDSIIELQLKSISNEKELERIRITQNNEFKSNNYLFHPVVTSTPTANPMTMDPNLLPNSSGPTSPKSSSMNELRFNQGHRINANYLPMTPPPMRPRDELHQIIPDDVFEARNDKPESKMQLLVDRRSRRRPGSSDFDSGSVPPSERAILGGPGSELAPINGGAFNRGGQRATAGARLGIRWNETRPDNFSKWGCEQICIWLQNIGLVEYVANCRRWIREGEQLLKATRSEVEKELGIHHPLHTKKIFMHLRDWRGENKEQLHTAIKFSLRKWMDDIGLFQYLSVFQDASIDMKVLDNLSYEDLAILKIKNELHVLSMKRGIQLLRTIKFDLSRLKRRPTDVVNNLSSGVASPLEVCLWTQHQVVEWLREIELPEYAPNVRGSGLHGALMVLEPRFDADVFAAVLNIPKSKSLLRRHLSSHFERLMGERIMKEKYENTLPINITAKIKNPYKKRFVNFRKSKGYDGEELLCPTDLKSSCIDLIELKDSHQVLETDIDTSEERAMLEKYPMAPSTNV